MSPRRFVPPNAPETADRAVLVRILDVLQCGMYLGDDGRWDAEKEWEPSDLLSRVASIMAEHRLIPVGREPAERARARLQADAAALLRFTKAATVRKLLGSR